jgi:hypothetical protein
MTDYHFTGAYPRVLAGLSQGVNALILPADRDAPPYGSTIEAHPGDAIQTDEPYIHPELEEVEPEPQPVDADGAPIPTPEPVVDFRSDAPTADPEHDTMTAEGSPAPAEPTA